MTTSIYHDMFFLATADDAVERSRFVPKKGKATPVPAWKCADWSSDALPANDPARDPTREVV